MAPDNWWTRDSVEALVKDLVLAEWRRLRPSEAALLEDAEPAVHLDSLERLQVANALATFFEMRHVGLEDDLLATASLPAWVDIVLRSLGHYDSTLGFRTSGSTGEPRVEVHSIAWLERETAHWGSLLGSVSEIAGVVPRHHIYGFLFTLLLPRSLGVPYRDARGMLPSRLAQVLAPDSLVIAYPDYWRLVASTEVDFPPGTLGVSSTAPCPDRLARQIAPGRIARLVQVYGSTETAGIGWREAPGTPYRLLPYWRRHESGLISDDSGGTSRQLVLPDLIEWLDADHFQVAGRQDRAVQIAGVNVYPEQVACALERHPGVRRAAVRAMRPDEGQRLKAFIVPADPATDPAALLRALREHVDHSLPAPERPRAFSFGPRLPADALGKACDWDLEA